MKKLLRNNFKLTPQKYKELKTLAGLLGKFQRRDNDGNLMFRKVTEFTGREKLKDGKFENKFNIINQPIMVNHEVNLVAIWQKDGQPGIDIYVKFFTDLRKEDSPNRVTV